MRITIDTAVDKKEDIRNAIDFLQRLADGPEAGFSQATPAQNESMMAMFGEDAGYSPDNGSTPASEKEGGLQGAGAGQRAPDEKKAKEKIEIYSI